MKIEKPLTENQKEVANKIYAYLIRVRRYVAKEELCAMLGWEYNLTNDRKVRDSINSLKKVRIIVATPDKKGYFAPTSKEDMREVIHLWRYLDKLEKEIQDIKKPVIKYFEKYGVATNDIFGLYGEE